MSIIGFFLANPDDKAATKLVIGGVVFGIAAAVAWWVDRRRSKRKRP